MTKVRAKFQVVSITKHAWGGSTIKMQPNYDPSIPEDLRFTKATPSGSLQMTIDNPSAVEVLSLGKFFYLDCIPVEE